MENASNALMIAGGVLIAILLVGIIVISFNGAADLAKTYDSRISSSSLQAFNNNFEKYLEGEIDVQEIITMTYFAKNYNTQNELNESDSTYISIECENIRNFEKKTDNQLIEFMKENTFVEDDNTTFQKYICKSVEYNEKTGTITKITFKKDK